MELRANQLTEGDVVIISADGMRDRVRGVWGDNAGRIVVATDRKRHVLAPTDLVSVTHLGEPEVVCQDCRQVIAGCVWNGGRCLECHEAALLPESAWDRREAAFAD